MPLVFLIANALLNGMILLLVASALLSWFPVDPRNRWVRLLHAVTDPILYPIRAIVPPIGGISFDVLIAVLLLQAIKTIFASAAGL